jgi:DNA-binding transcriptional MerR regulator
MPDDPYTLGDLARLADVTPRTVRYYVARGLLPSPGSAGSATRYGEGHLGRLRLIRRLQRDHLPLAEIRSRLERMGDDEVAAALAGPAAAVAPPAGPDETLAYVHALMARAGVAPRVYPTEPSQPPARAASAVGTFERRDPDEFPLREPPSPSSPVVPLPEAVPSPGVVVPPLSLPPATPAGRSTWERVPLAPDVELHVRRPLDRPTNRRVERLIRIARELFEDDPQG